MHKEVRLRLAKEYRYAATKMQETPNPARKLFYFSVLFGEAQRVLNSEWDSDLALLHMVTHQTHTQVTTQIPLIGTSLPIEGAVVYEKLTEIASDLATCFEKPENTGSREELYQALGRLAEIGYAVTGNGSYLYEKGFIKF
ncbi:MAG: hypothetical protein HYX80_07285 [Chloroflexi bacterium]|nr:hypothetical protein [Chloroflexota bacterium]